VGRTSLPTSHCRKKDVLRLTDWCGVCPSKAQSVYSWGGLKIDPGGRLRRDDLIVAITMQKVQCLSYLLVLTNTLRQQYWCRHGCRDSLSCSVSKFQLNEAYLCRRIQREAVAVDGLRMEDEMLAQRLAASNFELWYIAEPCRKAEVHSHNLFLSSLALIGFFFLPSQPSSFTDDFVFG
jgi:hypothetical protein